MAFLSTCFKGEVCLRLGPSKTNLYHLLRLSFVSLLSPLFRGFFFFFFPFFYFSFILFFSFSCFSVLLPFPLNPHLFFFFCIPNPRIEDAASEVKAASHDATISLPPPCSTYSSSGSSFPFLLIIFSFLVLFFSIFIVLIIVIFSLIIPNPSSYNRDYCFTSISR